MFIFAEDIFLCTSMIDNLYHEAIVLNGTALLLYGLLVIHAGSNIVSGGGSPQTLFDRGQRTAPTERRHCRQSSQQANGKKMG